MTWHRYGYFTSEDNDKTPVSFTAIYMIHCYVRYSPSYDTLKLETSLQAKRLRSCWRIDLSVGETTCRRNDRFPDELHLPLLVGDHPSTTLQITVLFLTQTLFKKLFRKGLRPLLRPEIWLIPLFSVSGKRPHGTIMYDKKTMTGMSQKFNS